MALNTIPAVSTDATKIPLSTVTAKGDLIAATASGTVSNLAVGTNGQVLTAASGQTTGLQWATPVSGSMTLLSTTTLSGASTTISSISGSYSKLYISILGVNNASNFAFSISPNGSTTITSNIMNIGISTAAQYSVIGGNLVLSSTTAIGYLCAANNSTNSTSLFIDNYSTSNAVKPFTVYSSFQSGSSLIGYSNAGGINTTSAITSLVFSASAGTFSAGTVLLYGVN